MREHRLEAVFIGNAAAAPSTARTQHLRDAGAPKMPAPPAGAETYHAMSPLRL